MLDNLKKIAWVDNLLLVTSMLSETLRSYPWLIFLSGLNIPGWTEPPVSLLSALVIIALVSIIVSLTLRKGVHIIEARLATLGLGITAILLITRLENGGGYALWDAAWFKYAFEHMIPIAVSLIYGLFLIWRGIVIGREEAGTDRLYKNFAIGVIGLIILMTAWAISLGKDSGPVLFFTLMPYVVSYFAASLAGLGLANFLSLRSGMGTRPKASDLVTRRWLITLIAVVVVIVCFSLFIASSISLNLITTILHPLNVAADWLLKGFLFIIGYPIGYLVTGLYWIIGIIATWIRGLNNQPFEVPEADFGQLVEDIQTGNMPIEILAILKWTVLIVAVALITFLLWRSLFRYWRSSTDKGYEEIHESLWGNLGTDIKSVLKDVADRFRRGAGRRVIPPPAATTTDASLILSLRELYRGLLWVGAESGHPKAIEQTPYEYQRTLAEALSSEDKSIALITDAYVQERYGHIQAGKEYILSLVKQWFALREALRSSQENDST